MSTFGNSLIITGAALATAVVISLSDGSASRMPAPRVDQAAPEISARFVSGLDSDGTLAAHRGNVVLLAVWATWCAACKTELPQLAELQATYSKRGLQVVAVSVDGWLDGGAVSDFVRPLGVGMTVLHDPRKRIVAQYGIRGLPAIILIDRSGVIRHRFAGAVSWNRESMYRNDLEALLRD